MLTINADEHAFKRNYHKPSDEKRMVVMLPEGACEVWLSGPFEQGMRLRRHILPIALRRRLQKSSACFRFEPMLPRRYSTARRDGVEQLGIRPAGKVLVGPVMRR